jgi:hypothetical protein
MALKLYGKSVDGSIPIRALLYDDEQLVASQDGVGIYEGLAFFILPPERCSAIQVTRNP